MPPDWRGLSVEAQLRDGASMLSLYRTALALRREHPELGDGTLTWLDSPAGTLAFRRGDAFACVLNMTPEWVEIGPGHGDLLLASGGPETAGDVVRIAPDSATWWTARDV